MKPRTNKNTWCDNDISSGSSLVYYENSMIWFDTKQPDLLRYASVDRKKCRENLDIMYYRDHYSTTNKLILKYYDVRCNNGKWIDYGDDILYTINDRRKFNISHIFK